MNKENKRDAPVIEERDRLRRQVAELNKQAAALEEANKKLRQELAEQKEQDLSKREKAEEELRAACEELRELDQLKNNFLANVSHELRTPLVAIKGYIELVLMQFPDRQTTTDWLNKSLAGCNRLESVIGDLLDISHLYSKKTSFKLESLNLSDIIESCIDALKHQLDKKSMDVDFMNLSIPALVLADEQKLRSVMLNLIENGIKFSGPGKRIQIKIERKDSRYYQLSFKDEGIGIPRKYLPKVFTRFFQVDSSPTRAYGGSGIGLALVEEIIRAHGGRVWLKSEEGKGSTFYVTLPILAAEKGRVRKNQETPPTPPPSPPGKQSKPMEILIADDDRDIRDFLKMVLDHEDLHLLLAASGEECLSLLEGNRPDVVMLDIAMPGLGGIEICRRIRETPELSSLPVYMLSARTGALDKKAAEEAGADGFLEKPFSIDELKALLESLHRKE